MRRLALIAVLCAAAQAQDWAGIHGVNFFTSNAGTPDEMWLRFEARMVRREIGWAHGLGFNSLRLWLGFRAWEREPELFRRNLSTALDLAAQDRLSVILVLFDACGIEQRAAAIPMTVGEAYQKFLHDPALPAAKKEWVRSRYRQFAEGRGKDMIVEVANDTPVDVLFWQTWRSNPGLSRMGRDHWPQLERYVDTVLAAASGRKNVLVVEVMNEPNQRFDVPKRMTAAEADRLTSDFLSHFAEYIHAKAPGVRRTIGSENVERLKQMAQWQDVLSIHCYYLGARLENALRESREFAAAQGKPILLTESLANTNNWLEEAHGEESRSTDEAQLRHYRQTLPILLRSGMGWYSWGFIAGEMFTPFTDILYPNGYRRPAAVYLEQQLKTIRP